MQAPCAGFCNQEKHSVEGWLLTNSMPSMPSTHANLMFFFSSSIFFTSPAERASYSGIHTSFSGNNGSPFWKCGMCTMVFTIFDRT